MDRLNKNWFVEGWIDFEYKKYILLAYLQKIKNSFDNVKLYPYLSDLIHHYEDLIRYNSQQNQLKSSFQKEIDNIDLKNLKISFNNISEDEIVNKIMEIVDYSIPRLKESVDRGTELYDFISSKIKMDSVGIIPFYKKEGYLLLQIEGNEVVSVYRYSSSIIHKNNDHYHGLMTKKIDQFRFSLANSLPKIKIKLIKKYTDLPTPATYVIHSSMKFPANQTIMPIAKRLLLKELTKAA